MRPVAELLAPKSVGTPHANVKHREAGESNARRRANIVGECHRRLKNPCRWPEANRRFYRTSGHDDIPCSTRLNWSSVPKLLRSWPQLVHQTPAERRQPHVSYTIRPRCWLRLMRSVA